mgnify:CR=1 FL=1
MFSRSSECAVAARSSDCLKALSRHGRRAVLCLCVVLSGWACTPDLVVVLDEANAEAYGGESELKRTTRRVSGFAERVELKVVESDFRAAVGSAYFDHPKSRIGIPLLRADTLQSLPADSRGSVIVLGGGTDTLPTPDAIAAENSREKAARIYFSEDAAIRGAAERIARLIEGEEARVMLFAGDDRENIDLVLETLERELGAHPVESGVAEIVSLADVTSDSEVRERVESFAAAGGRVLVSGSRERTQPIKAASETSGLAFVALFARLVASSGGNPKETSRTMRIVRPFEQLLEHALSVGAGEQKEIDALLRSD